MPLETDRTKIPYPSENDTDWWDQWKTLMADIDAKHYAAREDRNLLLQGGGTMTFNKASGVMSWSNAIRLFSLQNAFAWFVSPGTLTLLDGQAMTVVLPRGIEVNTTVPATAVTPPLPLSVKDTALVICQRVDDRLYFRNGMVLFDGDSFTLIESGGRVAVTGGGSLMPTMGLGHSTIIV